MKPLILHVFDDEVVKAKIARIRERLLAGGTGIREENFKAITEADLRLLFELYFEEYFDADTRPLWKGSFSLSRRMTKTAGKVIFNRRDRSAEIRIASTLLLRLGFTDPSQFYVVNGIRCYTRLDCLLRVFEHELAHVFEYLAYGSSNCSQQRFKEMVYKLFRHTRTKHEMSSSRDAKRTVESFSPGDRVRFIYQGITREGIIKGIRKRAIVLCDPVRDRWGRKVAPKFYVPLTKLIKIDRTGQA